MQDRRSYWVLAGLLAASAVGCDEGEGGRDGMEVAGPVGGKGDEATFGPAGLVVGFAYDGFLSGTEVWWRPADGSVRKLTPGKVETIEITGGDCLEVRTRNPADDSEIVTAACDDQLGLVVGQKNEVLLPVVKLSLDATVETHVEPHVEYFSIAEGSNEAVETAGLEYWKITPDHGYVLAPGVYTIKLGEPRSNDRMTIPEDFWALWELDLELDTYVEHQLPDEDWRSRALLDVPAPPAGMDAAFTGHACSVEHGIRVEQGSFTDYAKFETLDPAYLPELYVWPMTNTQIFASVSGISTDIYPGYGEDFYVEGHIHEVPRGEPAFEGGNPLPGRFKIKQLEDQFGKPTNVMARCTGGEGLSEDKVTSFVAGTYIVLPPGRYEQTVTYDGLSPETTQFEIRTRYEGDDDDDWGDDDDDDDWGDDDDDDDNNG